MPVQRPESSSGPQRSNKGTGSGEENNNGGGDNALNDEELLKQVTERVWQLLREDLRRTQERSGPKYRR